MLPAPAALAQQPAAPYPNAQPAGTQDARRPDVQGRRVIRVEVLDPLRITAHGQEICSGLRKASELLAFLAMHPGGATPEAISEALWPESPPSHGAAQRTLALRKARTLLRRGRGSPNPCSSSWPPDAIASTPPPSAPTSPASRPPWNKPVSPPTTAPGLSPRTNGDFSAD
jgi:hypothetical protein